MEQSLRKSIKANTQSLRASDHGHHLGLNIDIWVTAPAADAYWFCSIQIKVPTRCRRQVWKTWSRSSSGWRCSPNSSARYCSCSLVAAHAQVETLSVSRCRSGSVWRRLSGWLHTSAVDTSTQLSLSDSLWRARLAFCGNNISSLVVLDFLLNMSCYIKSSWIRIVIEYFICLFACFIAILIVSRRVCQWVCHSLVLSSVCLSAVFQNAFSPTVLDEIS